jgi:hypothetical protein
VLPLALHLNYGAEHSGEESPPARSIANTSTRWELTVRILKFTATTEAPNRLGLRELLQRYADQQWMAVHLTPEQAAESVLDCFKRAVAGELELLDLKCGEVQPSSSLHGE